MPLRLIHRSEPQDIALAAARFDAPGGTIGRCAGNTLVLPDTQEQVGRLQAVLRLQAGAATIQTLIGACPVAVNGELLAPRARRGLHDGDELTIGRFVLRVRDESVAREAAVPPAAGVPLAAVATAWDEAPAAATPAERDPPASQDSGDVFADLIGPGTLPVGSAPDMDCHPFDMASAAPRNTPDPLALVPAARPDDRPDVDPLALFGQDDGAPDVFSDRSPSAIDSSEPGQRRSGTLSDTLAAVPDAAPAHDHTRQLGGHLRPARVAEQAPVSHSNEKAKSP